MLKHSNLINGYDTLNLTKLDILDQLKEIQVAVGYEVDGKELDGFPGLLNPASKRLISTQTFSTADLDLLARVSVKYVTLPGWESSIAKCTSYESLPENCRKYIGFIEEFLGVGIEWIGVGPERLSMIRRELINGASSWQKEVNRQV